MSSSITVHRHKTAMGRSGLSRPVQLAIASGILHPETTLTDYGCGRGDDIRTLSSLGYDCVGWDPVHRPEGGKADPPRWSISGMS